MSTPSVPAVPVKLTGIIAACVTVLALGLLGALVGLYALAPADTRPDLTPLFQALGAGVPGVLGALAVWVNSRRQHAETTGALNVITTQTNGVLTDRITAGVASALAARDAAAAASAVVPVEAAP